MSEAVIKIDPSDAPARRADAIVEGIDYACTLLMDEYGWTASAIEERLDRTIAYVHAEEERRAS